MSKGDELFKMVYQWGRVGILVDSSAPAFQDELKKLINGDNTMEDLKKGDVIECGEIKEVVLARLEDLVWTQRLFDNGSKGSVSSATEIEDLATYGFKPQKREG